MTSGVKVVGTATGNDEEPAATGVLDAPDVPETASGTISAQAPDEQMAQAPHEAEDRRARPRWVTGGRSGPWVAGLAVLAALGLAGTIGFGIAWAGLHARQTGEAQASASARSFLIDLTNFDAKTVDADFGAVTSMATGNFATQAQKFFNSAIRQDLEKALASSRGQVRSLYVQSYGGGQATVYAVVDQLYVNDKITSPQTDVLRMVVTMRQVAGRWKVADVTVLQGPSLTAGSSPTAKGSASSTSGTSPSASSTSGT